MRAGILFISFKRLTRTLKHGKDSTPPPELPPQKLKDALLIKKAISRAAKFTPWESACLAQSLTAQRMLSRRGISGVFYLGVQKTSKAKEKIKAHAWSQCGETIITGAKGHETYTIVSTFSWSS